MSDDFIEAPELDDEDIRAIRRWGDIKPESNPLMRAGAERNVFRHANAWGMKLFATLLRECPALDPGQDPLEALQAILDSRDE